MPLTINFEDGTITVRDYEEITLADWKAFNPLDEQRGDPEDEFDNAIRKVCLYTGLPESTVEQWGAGTFTTVLTHVRQQIERAYAGSDKFKASLADGTEFIPESLILIGDKPYDVPLDMDRVKIAQFADWGRWEPPTHEADIVAESLAFMLVESGEDYQGTNAEKVDLMRTVPMEKAFDLCAFFFSRSDWFRNVTVQRSQKFRDWTRHLLTATHRTLPDGIADSIYSIVQPNSDPS